MPLSDLKDHWQVAATEELQPQQQGVQGVGGEEGDQEVQIPQQVITEILPRIKNKTMIECNICAPTCPGPWF